MMERARVFGVLGDPVDHSLSPAMHNAAFAALALPHLYLRYRVTPGALAEALAEARRLAMGGLNLTVPLKEVALPLLDEVTPAAARIRSVNTVCFRRGRLVGDNTDGSASVGDVFEFATRRRIEPVMPQVAMREGRAYLTIPDGFGYPTLEEPLELAGRH